MPAHNASQEPAPGLPAADLKDTPTRGLPVAPSLQSDGMPSAMPSSAPLPASNAEGAKGRVSRPPALIDRRTLLVSGLAVLIAVAAAFIARLLTALIGFVTNLAYYGRVSTTFASPSGHHLGFFAIFIPAIGGLIVGWMARYGSKAIRGHGIPEAMEQILTNQSRIPPRLTFLKPLSAAVAIGTGGPFGAEGPIIATGGALGSVVGQMLHTTGTERKILLAAGAAAGMTATFGSPIAAVILAIELLLFEFRPRSIIPVALASVTATGVRYAFIGTAPAFPMPDVLPPGSAALLFYALLGIVIGLVSVGVTRLVYAIEDAFERLPVGWVWWPAIGGLVVGAVGLIAPHTLGVGYDNIEHIVGGALTGRAVLFLCVMKLISWSISLGSGTSGGTLAPLFTIGGGLGAALGGGAAWLFPQMGIDVRIAALVGMAAIFAGASRALLASVIFAFETTRQPFGLLPLLGGCTLSYLVSCLLMQNTIMTEKIVRRGVRVPAEYGADFLEQVTAGSAATRAVRSLKADDTLEAVRAWINSGGVEAQHQGYPVVDAQNRLIGVVTRRHLLAPAPAPTSAVRDLIGRAPVVIYEDSSLREAADKMVRANIGRLPVVSRADPAQMVGILTRSDLLSAHVHRLDEHHKRSRHIGIRSAMRRRLQAIKELVEK